MRKVPRVIVEQDVQVEHFPHLDELDCHGHAPLRLGHGASQGPLQLLRQLRREPEKRGELWQGVGWGGEVVWVRPSSTAISPLECA